MLIGAAATASLSGHSAGPLSGTGGMLRHHSCRASSSIRLPRTQHRGLSYSLVQPGSIPQVSPGSRTDCKPPQLDVGSRLRLSGGRLGSAGGSPAVLIGAAAGEGRILHSSGPWTQPALIGAAAAAEEGHKEQSAGWDAVTGWLPVRVQPQESRRQRVQHHALLVTAELRHRADRWAGAMGAVLSHVLLRMRGTQLLVPRLLLARTDLIDACSLQTLALLHLDYASQCLP